MVVPFFILNIVRCVTASSSVNDLAGSYSAKFGSGAGEYDKSYHHAASTPPPPQAAASSTLLANSSSSSSMPTASAAGACGGNVAVGPAASHVTAATAAAAGMAPQHHLTQVQINPAQLSEVQ